MSGAADIIRKAFEHWIETDRRFKFDDVSLTRGEEGFYTDGRAQEMFVAWQAALSQKESAEPAVNDKWLIEHESCCATCGERPYYEAADVRKLLNTAPQSPEQPAAVPKSKGEAQKNWWIDKAKHLLAASADFANLQRNNLAADEEMCLDDDEAALWRKLEAHSVNCQNLVDFKLASAPQPPKEGE